MKSELSLHIFEKYPNVRLHENQPSGSQVFPRGQTYRRMEGQTDRQDKTHSRFSQFYERA